MNKGRPRGVIMSAEHRSKIQNSGILNALIEHALGAREMSSTQVQASVALLKKCLPDLSTVEMTGEEGGPIQTVSRIELVAAKINDHRPD